MKYRSTEFVQLLSVLFLSLTSFHVFADEPQEYLPIKGSLWGKAHPGILPYESCKIRSYDHGSLGIQSSGAAVIGGVTFDQFQFFLECESPKVGVNYRIAFNMRGLPGFGTGVGFLTETRNFSMSVTHLNGKTVGDFSGHFTGINATIGFIYGAAARFLSHNGIHILDLGAGDSAIGVELGMARFETAFNLLVPEGACKDDDFLLINGNTVDAKTEKDCSNEERFSVRRAFDSPEYATPEQEDQCIKNWDEALCADTYGLIKLYYYTSQVDLKGLSALRFQEIK